MRRDPIFEVFRPLRARQPLPSAGGDGAKAVHTLVTNVGWAAVRAASADANRDDVMGAFRHAVETTIPRSSPQATGKGAG
jgi:hypothetical protein